MMEWISVKDRLPEKITIVLVDGGIAYYDNGNWITCMGEDCGRVIQWDVTHWMPFPKLPKEKI